MAYYHGSIRSSVLEMDTTVNVIIPEEHYVNAKSENRTVILLHGLKQNADAWMRMSQAEIYAHYSGFNMIIPEVQRSFYADMPYGINYFTYITQELPEMMRKTFRIPMDREHLYVAGLSMGGYGAIKCALSYPDCFAGAMSYSGGLITLDNSETIHSLMTDGELKAILGDDMKVSPENDLMALAEKCASAEKKPWLYIACGTEDGLLSHSRTFARYAKDLGYPLTYEEWPGVHDWFFWDRALARSLAHICNLQAHDINALDNDEEIQQSLL